ncbi:hypothetical protein [Stappia sp. ES.058]|uniref:hypothetical protein n=1 Tax=Stappia sp. ES.058 TaxID=1881061 RepID=UPI00087A6FEA|nr:hypothetical protein [Stappia sp. ES.058]SDT94257.1 hypothetical protein SAMN05428979_0595 [Stappia sp. ES.058]
MKRPATDTGRIALAIAAFALFNGVFNPWLLPQTTAAVILLAPGLLVSSAALVIYLAYLFGALVTLVVAGVPAALYERFAGGRASPFAVCLVWLAATALLTLPAAGMAALLLLG